MFEMIFYLFGSIIAFSYSRGVKDLLILFKNNTYEYLRDGSNRGLHHNFKDKIEYT